MGTSRNRGKSGGSGSFRRSAAASKYYSHGSHAAKLEEAKDEVSLKYYGKQVKKEEKIIRNSGIKKIICSFIIAFCAISMVFARSMVSDYTLENKRLNGVLEEAKYKTETILAQTTENIDIEYVEEVATTRLNMAKPQPYQIVYIDVPKTDYTVLYGPSLVTEKEKLNFEAYKKWISSKNEETIEQ